MKTNNIVTERLILKSMTLDDCDFAAKLWGNGYATEVAREMIDFAYSLGVRDFHCTVATENIASCRVMEKCGLEADTSSSFKNHKTDVEHKSTIYKMSIE